MNTKIEPVMDENVENTPRAYIAGSCVVAYDEENNAWHSIYLPRNYRGQSAPHNTDGSKPAPSFSHMMIF